MAAVLAGSTGLVGSHLLNILISNTKFTTVHAFSRKSLSTASTKLQTIESADSESWPDRFPSDTSVFFSALGTTRGQAGGLEAQRKIDYDLNLALAESAQTAGVNTYVLISSSSAKSSSWVPYSKMKGELEDQVAKLGFKHVVILRPGLIIGERSDSRPAEYMARQIARFMGNAGGSKLTDSWAQDADVIAKAGVHAALQCIDGKKKEEGVWILEQPDIIRLGKTEWVEG